MSAANKTHLWHRCHHCEIAPIVGERHQCQTCPAGPDNNLCSTCYDLYLRGQVAHPLGHIRAHNGLHTFVLIAGPMDDKPLQWLAVRSRAHASPPVHRGSLVRPEFCYGSDSSFGAYGCVVASDHGALVLTALHVLDEVCRKNGIDSTVENTTYTGEELPRVISHVNLYDVLQVQWILSCLGATDEMLVLPEARSNVEEPASHRDLSAFVVKDAAKLQPLRLAKEAPGVGEPVWLAARYDHASRVRPAVVVEKTDLSYVFRFEATREGSRYTSGAPILNWRGEVVGVNVGSGSFEGRQFGHAIHAENIQKHLRDGRIMTDCTERDHGNKEQQQWSRQRH